MSVKCLNTLYDNTVIIQDCSRELEELSKSFRHVGNDLMAERLWGISLDLLAAQKEITQAYADDISKNLEDAEKASQRTVLMALDIIGKDS